MSAPSAWRPLSEAPKDDGAIVAARRTYRPSWMATATIRVATCCGNAWVWNDGDRVNVSNWEYAPIADTMELDRAVQSEIARAFGALIQVFVDNERHIVSRAIRDFLGEPREDYDDDLEQYNQDDIADAIVDFRTTLHTAMGGRIPDEVSR